MLEIVGLSILVMLASLAGVFSVWKTMGRSIEKNIHYLVSFSAGVFLVIVFHLATEAVDHAGSSGILAILVGAIFISLVFKLLPSFHMHGEHEGHDHETDHIDPRRILVSDGIHNIGDGILLAAAFTVSPTVAVAAAVSIFFHEIVQEISEFFVLRDGGYSVKKALTLNFLVSSTILIGSVGGFIALELFETLEAPLLGFAAGAFLMVVLGDLIPHSVRHSLRTAHYAKHIVLFLIGAVLMQTLSTSLGHSEIEEEHTPAEVGISN
ncbi:MAG TPA: ZIP family metal transporter [Candidatus Paceibacterota bacterium]|nr:ZIP family metal transporter [Candidatus Paceibacterota bacterium]